MHLGNELLTPAVALVTSALAAVGVGAAGRASARQGEERASLMGVLGAFVFAAQMLSLPLPFLPGASWHLSGAVLLAIVLGTARAILVMTAILTIQCLVFQDGGLLALGCNVINIAILPCAVGGWVWKRLGREARSASRVYLGSFLAAFGGTLAGASSLPFPIAMAGVSPAPLARLIEAALGAYVPLAILEGFATFGVVSFLHRAKPGLFTVPWGASPGARAAAGPKDPDRVGHAAIAVSVLAVGLVIAGLLSAWASGLPDALEVVLRSQGALPPPPPGVEAVDSAQAQIAVFPDYRLKGSERWYGTAIAGIAGTLLTLALIVLLARFARRNPERA